MLQRQRHASEKETCFRERDMLQRKRHASETERHASETETCFRDRDMLQRKFVEKTKTYFMFNEYFFFGNRAIYEIIWKTIVEPGRSQTTIWRMRIAC
jgi:hypothetical protein